VNLKLKKVVSNFLLSTLWNEHAHGVCLDRVFIKVDLVAGAGFTQTPTIQKVI
jgi:hypothetical protein